METSIQMPFDCQLLYFTSPSCLKNGVGIVFIGQENGNPNVFYRDFRSGRTVQLTHNCEGALKSYVYFGGHENQGLGKASVCLDPERGIVYYLQGNAVYRTDLAGNQTVLARLPEDQVTAFLHVSADGRRLCVPTTDARALEDAPHPDRPITQRPDFDIDRRVQDEGLSSYLRVFDTETGDQLLCERVEKAWITHVQFHPQNSDWILYNHEWPSFCGVRRMWLWDGETHRALRTIQEGRNIRDWVCHEMWNHDGSQIIYHGQYAAGGRYFLGRFTLATGEITEIPLPETYTAYGHFTISKTGLLVSDGYYRADPTESQARWITTQRVDWESRQIEWTRITRHDSSWASQDAHPHPVFSPDGNWIFYTTDASGKLEIRGHTVDCPA